jgi:hypothetical protein
MMGGLAVVVHLEGSKASLKRARDALGQKTLGEFRVGPRRPFGRLLVSASVMVELNGKRKSSVDVGLLETTNQLAIENAIKIAYGERISHEQDVQEDRLGKER